MEDQWIFFF